MGIFSLVLRLLLLIFLINSGNSRKPTVKFSFLNATTFFNTKYVSYYNVYIRPKAPGSSLEMEYDSLVNITKSPMTSVKLFMSQKDHERVIINIDYDYCSMVGSKMTKKADLSVDSLINFWVSTARRYSPLPKCPILAGHYDVKNLQADKKNIPSFVPFGKYRIEVSNYFKNPKEDIKTLKIIFDIRKAPN